MSFKDLPSKDPRELDLSDHTHAADVIDLITLDEDRSVGCFSVVLCDSDNRGLQPICLNELDATSRADAMAELLELVLPIVKGASGSVLMARGRTGPLRATDEDRAWHERAIDLCRVHEVRLLGFHVATPQGVIRLPDPLDAVEVA